MIRIGHGFDVHRFGGEGPIIIGGVKIPYEQGLIAHSDGDVALHALSDALLGAIAAGDIGRHFPDTDDKWKGADSRELLKDVYRRVKAQGYVLGNADVTIIAQAPKMAPYIQAMCAAIAEDLETDLGNINVKATTTENSALPDVKKVLPVKRLYFCAKLNSAYKNFGIKMTDILSPLAYLCGKPTAKAKLKALPEHFQVNEVLGYSLTGHGEHLMVRIRKTGENTSFVANELAKACGVPSRAVSWAGLKDRHAVTEQWLSVHLPNGETPDFSAFLAQYPSIEILEVTRHDKSFVRVICKAMNLSSPYRK